MMRALSVIFLTIISAVASLASTKERQPNVIVILADDLGYAGLSCFGGEGISTPELDKLAANGVRCTNFHANSTVCSPSRVALLSGRYQQRVGLDHIYFYCEKDKGFDPETNPSLPIVMKEAGYRTGIFGKWHLGSGDKFGPSAHKFDDFVGFLDGNIDFISKHNTESEEDWYVHYEKRFQEGYAQDLLNDAVVDFIDREHENPFFIYMPEAAIHVPLQGPDDPPLRTDNYYTYKVDHLFPKDEYMRRYSNMLTSMDQGVGKIMDALRRHNIEENTLIIFTSDNGGEPTGVKNGKVNGDHRGAKVSMYEGGLIVPSIVYWKGTVPAGSVNNDLMLTMDIFPTVLEFANIKYSGAKPFDGESLVSSILDKKPLKARDLFWMHNERLVMRRGDLKLIRQNQAVELYNLSTDPLESNNIAGDTAYSTTVAEMIEAGNKWHKETATGYPAEREIGVRVKLPWPCPRDLKPFNEGRSYRWIDGEGVVK